MKRFVLSRLAERDLQGIWAYIADDSVDAADRVLRRLRQEIRDLTKMPGKGHKRPDIQHEDLRFWRVYSYLIVYRFGTKPLEIVRVVHGAQDIPNILLQY